MSIPTVMTESKASTLVVSFALSAERIPIILPGVRVIEIVTGVGKSAAAIAVTEAIMRHHPAAVLNIGSAGTAHLNVGDIISVTRFIDRDLLPLSIEGVTAVVEMEKSVPVRFPSLLTGREEGCSYTVGTGDSFVTDPAALSTLAYEAIDMESFAVALACQRMNIPAVGVKYITDVIGHNSIASWEDKLSDARTSLTDYFQRPDVVEALHALVLRPKS